MKKKGTAVILCFIISISFCACGKDAGLSAFEKNMNDFTENISNISNEMDLIEPESETATTDLLACLDQMNEQFQNLATMDIPAKFSNVEDLALEAGSYMQEAVTLYHELYEAEEFNEEKATAASENYSRAMKRVSYISVLLQGEIPEGDDVVVTEEENDFTPITEPEE